MVLLTGHNIVQVFTADEVQDTMEYLCLRFASIALMELFHYDQRDNQSFALEPLETSHKPVHGSVFRPCRTL